MEGWMDFGNVTRSQIRSVKQMLPSFYLNDYIHVMYVCFQVFSNIL